MSDIHNLSVIEPPVRLYFSGHEQTSPSHACGPGIWPHYLLHYVLSGTGTFQSEKQSWRLAAGDAFLIIPSVISAYAASSTDPWEYCWIGFDGRDAADILSACGLTAASPVYHSSSPASVDGKAAEGRISPVSGSTDAAPCGLSLCSVKVGEAQAAGDPVGECLLSINDMLYSQPGNTYLHLSLLYRFFSLLSPDAGNAQKNSSAYLQQALDYLQHNYAYVIKIQDVARYVGIDRTYLYKLFTRELGISPQQYLIRLRLSMAKRLLASTDLHITEISNSCGFADSASFCHHFQAHFSITPSQFRKEPGREPVM